MSNGGGGSRPHVTCHIAHGGPTQTWSPVAKSGHLSPKTPFIINTRLRAGSGGCREGEPQSRTIKNLMFDVRINMVLCFRVLGGRGETGCIGTDLKKRTDCSACWNNYIVACSFHFLFFSFCFLVPLSLTHGGAGPPRPRANHFASFEAITIIISPIFTCIRTCICQ